MSNEKEAQHHNLFNMYFESLYFSLSSSNANSYSLPKVSPETLGPCDEEARKYSAQDMELTLQIFKITGNIHTSKSL